MRWKDGYTDEEKWRREHWKNRWKDGWHKWFAWYPVIVGNEDDRLVKVCGEYVLRKMKYLEGGRSEWEYKEIKEEKVELGNLGHFG